MQWFALRSYRAGLRCGLGIPALRTIFPMRALAFAKSVAACIQDAHQIRREFWRRQWVLPFLEIRAVREGLEVLGASLIQIGVFILSNAGARPPHSFS